MTDNGFSNALPLNMQEFNQITVVVFAQLYVAHPLEKTLNPADIAAVIGVSPTGVLPSGRPFDEMFLTTMRWLQNQGFIHSGASYPHERATLTARALAAMNALPPALQAGGTMPASGSTMPALQVTSGSSTGTVLVEAEQAASHGNRKQLVDLAGSFIGSIIRSTLGS